MQIATELDSLTDKSFVDEAQAAIETCYPFVPTDISQVKNYDKLSHNAQLYVQFLVCIFKSVEGQPNFVVDNISMMLQRVVQIKKKQDEDAAFIARNTVVN